MARPMTPQEVRDAQHDSIPDFVFEVVNDLLVKEMSPASKYAIIRQDDIADAIRARPEYNQMDQPPDIYEEHWMDFEDHYRQAGWIVDYDRPAYNENYAATFSFRPK